AILTAINCLGVRSGTNTQNVLMLLKLAAIVVLIVAGASVVNPARLSLRHVADGPSLLLRFAAGIAVSTLGFLSQSMLTAPRVYYAMAKDGVFFRAVGRVSEGARVPAVA